MPSNDTEKLKNVFQQGTINNVPLVLIIGTGMREISKKIIDIPWSCVVTTQAHSDLAILFRKEGSREVEELDTLASLENRITLSRRNLKFVHLFNTDETLTRKKNKAAADMLKLIIGHVRSSFGSLFIIGYDVTNKQELSSDRLTELLDDTRKQSAFIFATHYAEDENLLDAVNSGSLVPFEEPLESFLDEFSLEDDCDDDEISFDDDDKIIFINNKPIAIEKTQVFATQGFATLLSSLEIDSIKIPTELMREYFLKFLLESVSVPMWFGYEYKFNIQRNFEKKLYDRVEAALKKVNDRESQGVFVVSGQTGSSKSIALAHLAFKIYQKKIYPVIFIFDKNISFKFGESNFNALEKLILLLENKGARTVLIIWDNSAAYTDPIPSALHLLQGLRRRGRQCVLVCSAYMVSKPLLSKESGKKGIRIEEIETEISLSSEEAKQLRQNVLQLGGIDASQYDAWVQKEEKQNLLTLLYRLFTETLGNPLAEGVRTEVYQTSNIAFSFGIEMAPESINSLASHLQRAGVYVQEGPHSVVPKDFKEFLLLVAVASQFGVEMPLQFVLSVSGLKELENNFGYTIQMLQLFPFLRLPERAEDSRFNYGQSILFRTSLEASLYLKQCITAEEEILLIVKLIDALQDEHRYMEARTLDLLIRTIGPNSPLRNWTQDTRLCEYSPYYHYIIEALSRMRVSRKVIIPRLMCQEVCWIREVFGKSSKSSVEERIEKLNEAIRIAENALSKIKPGVLPGEEQITKNNLVVEKATSAWQIYQLQKEANSDVPKLSYDYDSHRKALEQVIRNTPDNSYAYNALLKIFISMYESSPSLEYAVDELSNILSMLESYEYVMGDVVYNEEFIQHKKDVLEFVGNEVVEEYLERLISQRKPSGLYLWAKRCLMGENINLDERVAKEKYSTLEYIVNRFTQYMDMVKSHAGCLYMLLRLKWQLFNHSPIFETEKQFTRISRQQWEELAEICRGDTPSQGNAHLLYISALVEAQVSNYSGSFAIQEKLQKAAWLPPRSTYVWHILCEEDGRPRLFSGRVEAQHNVRVIDVRETSNNNIRIMKKIFARDIYSLQINEPSGTYDDIEIGLNFKGFQAFRKLGGN